MGEPPVVILGAGPAGLAAARELAEGGVPVLVLEKRHAVGGIARTEVHGGYRFDVGGHRFFTKNRRIERLWHDTMGADLLRVRRLSRICYQGRFFRYPLSVSDTLRNLGLLESLLILLSYGRARMLPHPREDSFEQWVTNRFGRRLYEAFFKTYTEKVWGIPCDRIRADWAAQRIRGLSLAAAVSNAVLGAKRPRSLIEEFDYPREGPGMMWERFREVVESLGGEVRCGAEAVGMAHDRGRITGVRVADGSGRTRWCPADHVVSSVPLPRLVEMLDPPAPEGVRRAAGSLGHRSFLMVGLILDRPELFPDQWIYVHSRGVRVGRIQNFKNWSPGMVPDPSTTSVGMEYFCDEGDEIWSMPDGDLAGLASRELEALGLARARDVIGHHVVREPVAYPVYDEHYRAHLGVVREYLAGFGNLQTVGRSGMHRYNNMDHAMLTGILAARNVLGAKHDLWEVNEEKEYLEEDGARRIPEPVLRQAFARLDKLALATAVGAASGLGLLLATLWLVVRGGEPVGPHLRLLAQYLPGYTVTVRGSLLAAGYGFGWGFLGGWFLAYVRNLALALFLRRARRRGEVSLWDLIDRV